MYRALASTQALTVTGFAWIPKLGVHDPYFILPVAVAILAYFQQQRNLQKMDKVSASITKLVPAMSFCFMVGMPAGLGLYYATSGLIQLIGDASIDKWML